MLSRNTFFQEILALPPALLGYEAGRRLSAYANGRFLRELETWSFDVNCFARDGHCVCTPLVDLHQQIVVEGHHKEIIIVNPYNAWFQVHWKEHELELVMIRWTDSCNAIERQYLVAPDEAVANEFILEVCRWSEEIRSEVLVFHEGSWFKDETLYAETKDVRFEDIILPPGQVDTIQQDVLSFFEAQSQYERYNIPWKRGVLLYGPPGNGKTQTIKAILNTVQKPRLYVKSFESSYQTHQENIHRIFERAREVAPCVLIFEDLDSLIDEKNRSFFLNELDGFSQNHGILTLATTNYIEKLDDALVKRPSRFDRKYFLDLPSSQERLTYISMWNRNLASELKLELKQQHQLAEMTEAFSYAFLKELFVSGLMLWIQSAQSGSMGNILLQQCDVLRQQIESLEDESPKDESPEDESPE